MKKLFFFIILFFVFSYSVKGSTAILNRNPIDNTYSYYYDNDLARYRFLYADKYSFGDTIAYCLELGKAINTNIYTMTTSFDSLNIPKSDIEYIKRASYYGYDYPGHQTDKYYMATQELIWDRISSPGLIWVRNLNPNDEVDVSNEKNEIRRLIGKYDVKPSFDGREFELYRGKKLFLTDSNYVLKDYEVIEGNATIEGDGTLMVKDGEDINKIVLRRRNYANKSFFIYTAAASQMMMSAGTLDMPISSVTIKFKSGSLTVNKLDKETNSNISSGEATLNGAIYDVFNANNEYVDYIETGKKNKLEKLGLGKYYIKERSPSNGYLLDNETYEIEITKDNLDIALNVYEEVIKRKVEIFKVFASHTTGIMTSEGGVVFDIYDANDIKVDSITTDNDGYASITLPYGKYKFKQVTSTEGYYMVDDFIVDINKADERPIYKLLSDGAIEAKVRVIKKDLDTGSNIVNSNVKFKIYDVNKKEFIKFRITYPEIKEFEELSVNEDGTVITPSPLAYGKYILYEVDDKVDGYLYNKEGIPFNIDKDTNLINDDNYGPVIEVLFYNKRVKGKVVINKYGEKIQHLDNSYYYKNILLDNVIFELYARDDIYENNTLIYNKDELVQEIVTNANGRAAIDNLPLGNYYLKETNSSHNNEIGNEIYEINLIYKDQYTEKVNYELDINNYMKKGKLVINKFDSETKERLANTLIEIWDSNNNTIYKGYTDNYGTITLDDLLYGDYIISEIEASTGYRLLEDNISFTMDSESYEIDIYNERLKVPNTSLPKNIINIIVLIVAIISILIIIFFFESKKVAILCFVIALFSVSYLGFYYYRLFNDKRENNIAIEKVINKKYKNDNNDKYSYDSFIEIPNINLRRGIVNINNKYNKAEYNIELIEKTGNRIVLAAHNGDNYNSYFGELHKLELGSEMYFYDKGHIYKYIFSYNYEIKKNGYADIYTDNDKKSIVLITCSENSDISQTVYIGYLKEIMDY